MARGGIGRENGGMNFGPFTPGLEESGGRFGLLRV